MEPPDLRDVYRGTPLAITKVLGEQMAWADDGTSGLDCLAAVARHLLARLPAADRGPRPDGCTLVRYFWTDFDGTGPEALRAAKRAAAPDGAPFVALAESPEMREFFWGLEPFHLFGAVRIRVVGGRWKKPPHDVARMAAESLVSWSDPANDLAACVSVMFEPLTIGNVASQQLPRPASVIRVATARFAANPRFTVPRQLEVPRRPGGPDSYSLVAAVKLREEAGGSDQVVLFDQGQKAIMVPFFAKFYAAGRWSFQDGGSFMLYFVHLGAPGPVDSNR